MSRSDTDDWSCWPAPAKLNLFLRVLGRRSDGYHALQTVFQLLDWGDRIHVRVRTDGVIRRVERIGSDLSDLLDEAEGDGLPAFRAAERIVLQRLAAGREARLRP